LAPATTNPHPDPEAANIIGDKKLFLCITWDKFKVTL
jgi:hypothetical protein